jgi:hypothetical protein
MVFLVFNLLGLNSPAAPHGATCGKDKLTPQRQLSAAAADEVLSPSRVIMAEVFLVGIA